MNEAIKLAIEKGGYEGASGTEPAWDWHMSDFQNRLVLDPLFWQALGKALWWGNSFGMMVPSNTGELKGWLEADSSGTVELWRYHAHQYFDIVLIGGDTEKFWKELLTK